MADRPGTLTRFLNTVGYAPKGITLVNPSSPVDWTRLGFAIVLGVITQIALGVQAILNAWADATVAVLMAPVSWFTGTVELGGTAGMVDGRVTRTPGVLDTVFGPLFEFLNGSLGISLSQYGILAWLPPLVVTLGSLYLFTQAVAYAYRTLTGGGPV